MKFVYYLFFTTFFGLASCAESQSAPTKKETASPTTQLEPQQVTQEVRRRLKSFETKESRCFSYAYDDPFPENLEQFFENTEILVFAYPGTYTCDAPIDDKIVCDVNKDSAYFVQKDQMGAKIYFRGEDEFKIRFGGPRIYECRKPRNKKRSTQQNKP